MCAASLSGRLGGADANGSSSPAAAAADFFCRFDRSAASVSACRLRNLCRRVSALLGAK
jgi:hypothetical protein